MKVYLIIKDDKEEIDVKAYGSRESAVRAMKKMASELAQDLTENDYDVDVKWRGDAVYLETWASLTVFRIEEQEVLS